VRQQIKQINRGILQMPKPSQIKERMEVKGSDGKHVGTVLEIERGAPQAGIRRHGA